MISEEKNLLQEEQIDVEKHTIIDQQTEIPHEEIPFKSQFDEIFVYDEILLKLRSDREKTELELKQIEECTCCNNEVLKHLSFEAMMSDHKFECNMKLANKKSIITNIDTAITNIEDLLKLSEEQKEILLKFEQYTNKSMDSSKKLYMGIIAKYHKEMIGDERILHLISVEGMDETSKKQAGLLIMSVYPVSPAFLFK